MNTHWQEKGELGDKCGYNNHSEDGELVSILMLYREMDSAGDEEDGHSVSVPSRVLKRYMKCECVGILEQAFSCPFEGMLVNKGAVCSANMVLEFWAQRPCGAYFHASAGID